MVVSGPGFLFAEFGRRGIIGGLCTLLGYFHIANGLVIGIQLLVIVLCILFPIPQFLPNLVMGPQ